jgi:RimJ/RimL family protein N-acetyltransferase
VPLHSGETFSMDEVSIGPPDVVALVLLPKTTDAAASFARWTAAADARNDVHYFAIVWRDAPVGQVLRHDIDWMGSTALVGYHIFAPCHRGRGIGSAALALLLQFVEERTTLRELIIITSRDNLASRRIAQKCGFVEAGAPREDLVNGVVYRWERSAECPAPASAPG